MYSTSQHFQLVYFSRFATFSKARHAVIYGVGSLDDRSTPSVQKHVGTCEAGLQKTVVRTYNSCTSMIRLLCLDKYVNTKLLACVYKVARGWGGRSPRHLKSTDKHQNTPASCNRRIFFFFCIVGGGAQPPPICKTWTTFRTRMSSCIPLMDLYCNVFCDMFALRDNCDLQYTYSSTRRKD